MWLLHGLPINRQWWLLRWAPPLGTFGESPVWLARDTLESAFPWPHRLSLLSTVTCMNFSHARQYFMSSCENLFVARPPYLKVITIVANRNDFLSQYFLCIRNVCGSHCAYDTDVACPCGADILALITENRSHNCVGHFPSVRRVESHVQWIGIFTLIFQGPGPRVSVLAGLGEDLSSDIRTLSMLPCFLPLQGPKSHVGIWLDLGPRLTISE